MKGICIIRGIRIYNKPTLHAPHGEEIFSNEQTNPYIMSKPSVDLRLKKAAALVYDVLSFVSFRAFRGK
jgi:hypothetical protein